MRITDPAALQRVLPLVSSRHHLSVSAYLSGLMPGEAYVDDPAHPRSAFLRTCEGGLLAGYADNPAFLAEVASILGFWEQVCPDTAPWEAVVSLAHPNKYVRKYGRKHYTLRQKTRRIPAPADRAGFTLFPADRSTLSLLRREKPKNWEKVCDWVSDWSDDEAFCGRGFGALLSDGSTVAAWSLCDCRFGGEATIGVTVDPAFRGRGFGKTVADAAVGEAFARGDRVIHWLCVSFNRGSIALAESLGFRFLSDYSSFTSYPPCENLSDLTEEDWRDWGIYYKYATRDEKRLLKERLYAFVKANDPDEALLAAREMAENGSPSDPDELFRAVKGLQSLGLCAAFDAEAWRAELQSLARRADAPHSI